MRVLPAQFGWLRFAILTVITLSLYWWQNPLATIFSEWKFQLEQRAAYIAAVADITTAEPIASLAVPVLGVEATTVANSFGAPRGNRSHEGVDIFADRGTYIRSGVRGIVTRIGTNGLGGNVVGIMGPGRDWLYYAHLDSFDPQLEVGQLVDENTLIGKVGTSGNAVGTPPHLHFGMYRSGRAIDPLPIFE